MMRHHRLEHRFVTSIPRKLEQGLLYVSMEYATAAHSCCCGCGQEVVTPLTPTDWQLTFDGETVSLWPSIGNWSFECKSHYIIERSEIIQVVPWSDRKIDRNRFLDRLAKSKFYAADQTPHAGPAGTIPNE